MPTLPSMPKAEELVAILRQKVAIFLGVVVVCASLVMLGLEIWDGHAHWSHLLLIFVVMVLGVGLIVPDFSLRFLSAAGGFLGRMIPSRKVARGEDDVARIEEKTP